MAVLPNKYHTFISADFESLPDGTVRMTIRRQEGGSNTSSFDVIMTPAMARTFGNEALDSSAYAAATRCPTCGSEGPLATDTTCASCEDGLVPPLRGLAPDAYTPTVRGWKNG